MVVMNVKSNVWKTMSGRHTIHIEGFCMAFHALQMNAVGSHGLYSYCLLHKFVTLLFCNFLVGSVLWPI